MFTSKIKVVKLNVEIVLAFNKKYDNALIGIRMTHFNASPEFDYKL